MPPIDPRDFGKLEAKVDHLSDQLDEMTKSLQALQTILDQTKGGWRVIVIVAGFTGAATAFVIKFLPFWPFR